MMQILSAVIAAALLFTVYGLLRPRSECGPSCALCDHACTRAPQEENHD